MRPQICAEVAAPPSKYPRFWGSNDFFEKLPKKDPAGVRLYSALYAPRCYFHSDIPPGTSNTKRMAPKKPQGGRRRRHRPRRAIAYIFSYIGENRIATPLGVFSARFRGRWVRRCMRHATAKLGSLVHRFNMISVGLHARENSKLFFGLFWTPPNRGYFEGGAATSAQI